MDYELELTRLYVEQERTQADGYLHAHSRNRAVIRRQIVIFERCIPYLRDARVVLDWGCRHAADACLMRMLRGADVQLEACDIEDLNFRAFFDFAGLRYTRLTHPYRLPYDDNQFDAVIGGGVLEHVPNDSASLTELHRVIRPDGHLVVTMLPNCGSYTEWLNRRLGNPHHLRLYSLREIRHMFIHHGFIPVASGYHQMIPALSSCLRGIFDSPLANGLVESLFVLNAPLERVPLLNRLATNLFIVGRKVEAIHG